MGNFYTNIAVIGADAERVLPVLQRSGREAFVAPCGSDCVVFDRDGEGQDTEILAALAERISHTVASRAFAVLNHDDDVLWFQLYSDGELLTEHANAAGSPRASARVLSVEFGRPGAVFAIWSALHVPLPFQILRHRLLARVLGLPAASVGMGYRYIEQGEVPDGVSKSSLIHLRAGG